MFSSVRLFNQSFAYLPHSGNNEFQKTIVIIVVTMDSIAIFVIVGLKCLFDLAHLKQNC